MNDVKRYEIRKNECMSELVTDYFDLHEQENFYDLDYKDFKKIFLQNLVFLYQRNFLITLDEFCYLVRKYFEEDNKKKNKK